MEVVRYDRAGKWYLEPVDPKQMLPCQHVTVEGAAQYAVWLHGNGGEIFFDLPGGRRFDRIVRTKMVRLDA